VLCNRVGVMAMVVVVLMGCLSNGSSIWTNYDVALCVF
jgi:hypothetical protein